jgi:hypothetical protein
MTALLEWEFPEGGVGCRGDQAIAWVGKIDNGKWVLRMYQCPARQALTCYTSPKRAKNAAERLFKAWLVSAGLNSSTGACAVQDAAAS